MFQKIFRAKHSSSSSSSTSHSRPTRQQSTSLSLSSNSISHEGSDHETINNNTDIFIDNDGVSSSTDASSCRLDVSQNSRSTILSSSSSQYNYYGKKRIKGDRRIGDVILLLRSQEQKYFNTKYNEPIFIIQDVTNLINSKYWCYYDRFDEVTIVESKTIFHIDQIEPLHQEQPQQPEKRVFKYCPYLILLRGMIPYTYQGNQYHQMIEIYLPSPIYPSIPPVVYVRTTPDMAIRSDHPHICVQDLGKMYLPYLSDWKYEKDRNRNIPPNSSLIDLVQHISQVFAKLPPCRSLLQQQTLPLIMTEVSDSSHTHNSTIACVTGLRDDCDMKSETTSHRWKNGQILSTSPQIPPIINEGALVNSTASAVSNTPSPNALTLPSTSAGMIQNQSHSISFGLDQFEQQQIPKCTQTMMIPKTHYFSPENGSSMSSVPIMEKHHLNGSVSTDSNGRHSMSLPESPIKEKAGFGYSLSLQDGSKQNLQQASSLHPKQEQRDSSLDVYFRQSKHSPQQQRSPHKERSSPSSHSHVVVTVDPTSPDRHCSYYRHEDSGTYSTERSLESSSNTSSEHTKVTFDTVSSNSHYSSSNAPSSPTLSLPIQQSRTTFHHVTAMSKTIEIRQVSNSLSVANNIVPSETYKSNCDDKACTTMESASSLPTSSLSSTIDQSAVRTEPLDVNASSDPTTHPHRHNRSLDSQKMQHIVSSLNYPVNESTDVSTPIDPIPDGSTYHHRRNLSLDSTFTPPFDNDKTVKVNNSATSLPWFNGQDDNESTKNHVANSSSIIPVSASLNGQATFAIHSDRQTSHDRLTSLFNPQMKISSPASSLKQAIALPLQEQSFNSTTVSSQLNVGDISESLQRESKSSLKGASRKDELAGSNYVESPTHNVTMSDVSNQAQIGTKTAAVTSTIAIRDSIDYDPRDILAIRVKTFCYGQREMTCLKLKRQLELQKQLQQSTMSVRSQMELYQQQKESFLYQQQRVEPLLRRLTHSVEQKDRVLRSRQYQRRERSASMSSDTSLDSSTNRGHRRISSISKENVYYYNKNEYQRNERSSTTINDSSNLSSLPIDELSSSNVYHNMNMVDWIQPLSDIDAQLIHNDAQYHALCDAIVLLNECLDNGYMGCEKFLKEIRKIAKAQFLILENRVKLTNALQQRRLSI